MYKNIYKIESRHDDNDLTYFVIAFSKADAILLLDKVESKIVEGMYHISKMGIEDSKCEILFNEFKEE